MRTLNRILLGAALLSGCGIMNAATLEFQVMTNETCRTYGEIPIKLFLYNNDPTGTLDAYTIGLEYGGKTLVQEVTDDPLKGGANKYKTLQHTVFLPKYGEVEYSVWVDYKGQKYEVAGNKLKSYPFKAVCEEVTATWCQYCVRGIVAMEDLRENYPYTAIGLAVHKDDVMTVSSYFNGLSNHINTNGIPTGGINRSMQVAPEGFKNYLTRMRDREKNISAIRVSAELNPEIKNAVLVNTEVWFAHDLDDASYALAYVISENDINVPGNSAYNQNNYYSGSATPMGGYENMPSVILAKDMYYQDVVRGTIGSFNGYDGVLPASFSKDVPESHSVTFTLPSSVLVAENTELTVMLIDRTDNHISNAERISLRKVFNPSAVDPDDPQDPDDPDEPDSSVKSLDGSEAPVPVARFALDGTPVGPGYRGMQIILLSNGKTLKTFDF